MGTSKVKMEKLPMCRICLVEDVRMYVVVNKNLHELYEKLTDVPFVTKDSRPILACFYCCTKLKQCWRFLRKCLEAEELFSQMMNENCEADVLINPEQCFNGFVNSPIVHISIGDGGQTESDAIKEELSAVWERPDEIIDPEAEHQTDEQELGNVDNCYAAFKDTPAHQSESDSDDDEPVMEIKTKVEDEQESIGAAVVEKPTQDTRRAKLEDILAVPKKNSRKLIFASKIIQKTQNRTSNRVTKFNEPIATSKQRVKNRINKTTLVTSSRKNSNKKNISGKKSNKRKDYMNGHLRVCVKDKRFKCDICQKSYTNNFKLTLHIRSHTGEKPFKCDICSRSFNQISNLTRHIRVHTGERPFKCDICQRSFAQKSNLTSHIRVHTGEKPFKCDLCQLSFTDKSNLKKHIRVHTGEKPFNCDICSRSFCNKSHLMSHIRVHTGEKHL